MKESHRQFVLLLSEQLNLDQQQSLELFETFVGGVYTGSPSRLNSHLAVHKQQHELLEEVRGHYYSERLTLLHCVKHLLGYWQDVSHPYQVSQLDCSTTGVLNIIICVSMMLCVMSQEVYRKCLEKIDENGDNLIKGVSHFNRH